MLSKSKIKLINSLKLAKNRKLQGLFVAEGTTNVIDFIKGNIGAEELYATAEWIELNGTKIKENNVIEVKENDLKKITFLKNPPGIVGLFKIPSYPKIDLNKVTDLVLVLDDIRDPGNLGTIIRTADWFGITDIVCSETSADAFNPKVVQASMGSLARVKVHYADLKVLLESKPGYLKIFGTVLDGDNLIEIPKPHTALVLIGNEAHGISKELLRLVDQKITIPAPGSNSPESLNASIAAAIVCYEFRR